MQPTRNNKKFWLYAISFSFLFFMYNTPTFAQQKVAKHYKWQNVQITGAGFVSGIVCHPKEKGLRYCRTDIGGAYRWDNAQGKWVPLLDWLSLENSNLMG